MKKTVLLLDDERGVRADLSHWLEKKGFTVHAASTLEEAMRIIQAGPVDCAVVDLNIDFRSENGGMEMVHFLRQHHPQVKTIVMTAHEITGSIRDAIGGECDGFVSKGAPENYITAVIDRIQALSTDIPARQCFVIMPFSKTRSCRTEEWTEIFFQVIKPAVEGAGYNYTCTRSQALSGNIIEDILDNLNRADLVVADLTDRNPNVFYELGVRHALRRGTILISQRLLDVPFDLRPYAVHEYRWKTRDERSVFTQRLRDVIAELDIKPTRGASPVLRYLGKSEV